MEQHGNQWWTSRDWDEFFNSMKIHNNVLKVFKDIGLFEYINQYTDIVTKVDLPAVLLDYLLFANCGQRKISPLVEMSLDKDRKLSDSEAQKIGQIIAALFKNKWDRLYDVILKEYDPIYNYYDEYHETTSGDEVNDIDVGKERGIEKTNSGTDTTLRTDDLTRTDESKTETSADNFTDNKLYGFNSGAPVGSDNSNFDADGKEDFSETEKNTGTQRTETTLGTKSNEEGKEKQEFDAKSESHGTKDYKKFGNIGNLTTQQLLNQEIELWKWNFLKEVMDDVKDTITIPVY